MAKVPIADIVTERVVPDDTDIDDLVKQIKESGTVEPIIVYSDMTLIDGLKRIRAADSLGWREIDAIISDDIQEIVKLLTKVHAGVSLTPQRIYEQHIVLYSLNDRRLMDHKKAGTWNLTDRPDGEERFRLSNEIWKASGLSCRSAYGRLLSLYRAREGSQKAQWVLERVKDNDLSIQSASYLMTGKRVNTRGVVKDPTEQRRLLESGMRSIITILSGINKIGSPIQISEDEMWQHISKMGEARRLLSTLQSKLRHGIRSQDK